MLCLLAAFLFFGLGKGRSGIAAGFGDSGSSASWPDMQEPVKSSTIADPLGRKAAENLVSESLAIRNTESIGKSYILNKDTTPEAALSILTDLMESEGEITDIIWIGTWYVGELLIEGVVVEFSNGKDTSRRLAQIPLGDGGKIDFDSFIRRSSHPWETILSKQTEPAIVRVNIKKSNYYNGTFSDEAHWNSYAISSPDIQETLYAYAAKNSSQDLELAQILEGEDTNPRATLEIGTAPSAENRQFIITRVVAEDWIASNRR